MTKFHEQEPEEQITTIIGYIIGIISAFIFFLLTKAGIPFKASLIIISIIAISLLVYFMKSRNKGKKKIMQYFSKMSGFNPSRKYFNKQYGNSGIAYDKKRNSIALVQREDEDIIGDKYNYKDLLSAEVCVDGNTITKTSRSSQIGRAILGGITFGPIGAVIGGLSGKKKTEDTVSRVDLQVVVNDENHPRYIVNFMVGKTPKKYAKYYINKAKDWKSLIETLIKKADEEDEK